MAQILDSLTTDYERRILCRYRNNTPHIQIARICNIASWYFERTVFPGERLLFEALPEAQLEIHMGTPVTAILTDKIQCNHLQVNELSCYK
ncbi:MAG: DUF1830 domain-containing protein [Chroococcidiopsidaceae cyanobacterium CP_BM_RX_35]|nr:DUF1830 domain-containing protein [Chroococcidiopsidaceae cyanobacterium CP_BM_RX_35]